MDIALAIVVQNLLQPKNKQRTDAIADKSYVEFNTSADANDYLARLMQSILKSKVQASMKVLSEEAQQKLSKRDAHLFL